MDSEYHYQQTEQILFIKICNIIDGCRALIWWGWEQTLMYWMLIKCNGRARKKWFSYWMISSTSLQGFEARCKALESVTTASNWGLVIPTATLEKYQSSLADCSHVATCKLSPVSPGCFCQPISQQQSCLHVLLSALSFPNYFIT